MTGTEKKSKGEAEAEAEVEKGAKTVPEYVANCRRRLLPGRRNLPLTFGSWSLDFVQLDGKSWRPESQLQPPAYVNYNKTAETRQLLAKTG